MIVMDKKEIQDKILKSNNHKATDEEFSAILKILAPGTYIRAAIDGAQRTQRGAIIVIENENLFPLLDGGFRINARFTPQKLVELAKMDGAIILSKDIKRITFTNVLLTPSSKIKTEETGTRHKAAERTAKEAGTLVIAISERKNEISVFYKNIKHILIPTEILLRKANESIQLLEKQRELFDQNVNKLNSLEIRNYPSIKQALLVIQKGKFIQKISEQLNKYIIELGKEGTLLKLRLKELLKGIDEETELVIKDYTELNLKTSVSLLENLSYDEILEEDHILSILGHNQDSTSDLSIKGWRILQKTCLTEAETAEVIRIAGSLGKALHSNSSFYMHILGEKKSMALHEELRKIKLEHSFN